MIIRTPLYEDVPQYAPAFVHAYVLDNGYGCLNSLLHTTDPRTPAASTPHQTIPAARLTWNPTQHLLKKGSSLPNPDIVPMKPKP